MYSKKEMKDFLLESLKLLKKYGGNTYKAKVILDREGFLNKITKVESYVINNFTSFKNLNIQDEELESFLKGYLVKTNYLEYNEKHFNELYYEYRNLKKYGSYKFRTVVLVNGISIDDTLDMKDFRLSKISNENLEYFINNISEYHPNEVFGTKSILKNSFGYPKAMIEFQDNLKSIESVNVKEKIERLGKAILLEYGMNINLSFSNAFTYCYLKDNGMPMMESFIYAIQKDTVKKMTKLDDKENILNTYKMLNEIPETISFKRYISAYNKVDLEDQFIDMMVSLESLYPSIRQELTFRLSLYTAVLLGKDKRIYETIREMYKKRSKIIHGSSELPKEEIKYAVDTLDDILRKVLQLVFAEYLVKGKTLFDLEMDLMECLFD